MKNLLESLVTEQILVLRHSHEDFLTGYVIYKHFFPFRSSRKLSDKEIFFSFKDSKKDELFPSQIMFKNYFLSGKTVIFFDGDSKRKLITERIQSKREANIKILKLLIDRSLDQNDKKAFKHYVHQLKKLESGK